MVIENWIEKFRCFSWYENLC